MLIYEVNLKINPDIYTTYISWLKNHIQEILSFPGFDTAQLLTEQNTTNHNHITIQYYVDSEENLSNYLTNHAPQMRADGLDKFNGKFSATRRIFNVSETFKNK